MTTLRKISRRECVGPGRYLVCEDGPDCRSTYMECWGQNARYQYRAIEATDSLPAARSLVSRFGVIMDTVAGRQVQ
jgi:hypothetical protein